MGIIQNIKNHKVIWAVSLLLSAVIITAGIIFYFTMGQNLLRDPNVLAVVGDTKITKTDLNEQIYGIDFAGTPENPGHKTTKEEKEYLLNKMIENIIIEKVASEKNISVSDSDIQKEATKRRADYVLLTPIQKDLIYEQAKFDLLQAKVQEDVVGWREGKYMMFHFDKYFKDNEQLLGITVTDEMVQKQKDYADKLSKSYYEKISKKEWTFEQAMEELEKDKEISANALLPINPNIKGQFGKLEWQNNYGPFTTFQGFKEKAVVLKEGETSQPFMVKSTYYNSELKETAYGLVKVDKSSGGSYAGSYEEWLKEQKNKYNVKTYSENIGFKFEFKWKDALGVKEAKAAGVCPTRYGVGVDIYLRYRTASGGLMPYVGVVSAFGGGAWGPLGSGCHPTPQWDNDPYICRPGIWCCNCNGGQYAGEFGTEADGVARPETASWTYNCGNTSYWWFYLPKHGVNGNTVGAGGSWSWDSGSSSPVGGSNQWYWDWPGNYTNGVYQGDYDSTASNITEQNYVTSMVAHLPSVNGNQVRGAFIWEPTWNNGEGSLIDVNCDKISGYSFDRDNLGVSNNVSIVASLVNSTDPWYGANAWSAYPEKQYKELFWYNNVPTDINHNFSLDVPPELKDGRTWYIYAYGLNLVGTGGRDTGGNSPLAGSPQKLENCVSLKCNLDAKPAEGVEPLTATLIANPIPTGFTPSSYTYFWTFGDGQTATGTQTQNHTYVMDSTKKANQQVDSKYPSVTITEGSKGLTCEATKELKIRPWAESNWLEVAP